MNERIKELAIEWQIIEVLEEFSEVFRVAMQSFEKEEEEFWNSLSKEDQLKAFCAVVRRIHKAELIENRSYRGVLYDTFGFGLEAYAQAHCAGFIDIHNKLYDGVHSQQELDAYYHALTHIAAITTDEEIRKVILETTKNVENK
jgi:F0F1-type ATP synthase delta subunit